MRRRGQEFRMSSPLVVLLIAVVIILYILFLPPAEREALLTGTTTPGGGSSGGGVLTPGGAGVVVMDKYLGTLLPQSSGSVEHAIPTTTVFTSTNTEEVKFVDSMGVSRSAFSRQDATLTFNVELGVAKNHLLTFNVDEYGGPLTISLNDQPIFSREITTRSPAPITLPQELLKPQNTLTFTAGTPGWAFWKSNTYSLRNVLVSADVTRYDNAAAEQHFTITPAEHEKLETAKLEFVPECDAKKTGRLSITLNGNLLYAGYMDCGILTRQEVAKESLVIGDNRIGFTSGSGGYTIDRIKLVSTLKEQDYPVLYFNLPPDLFQQANVFAGRVVLTLRFSEGNTLKTGSIVVNGFQDSFQTDSYYYQATLDPNILVPNANSIQVIPVGGALHIPEVRIEMLG